MANVNKVILIGNLTRDIEIKYTQGGLAVAKFGMAINRKFKQGDEQKESVCYVDLTSFGKQAEVLNEYCGKGSPLFVEGRLDYSTWEDRDSGKNRSKLEVIVENFQFLGGKSEGGGKPQQSATAGSSRARSQEADYGDIPF